MKTARTEEISRGATKLSVIGIDPGFKGAIALYRVPGVGFPTMQVRDMPTTKQSGKIEIDTATLAAYAQQLRSADLLTIEDVHAFPGQGVVSMFRFGYGAGLVAGMFMAHYVPVVKIKPSIWKASLGLSADKEQAIEWAVELFGQDVIGKKDGRAEAALLAYFGWLNLITAPAFKREAASKVTR